MGIVRFTDAFATSKLVSPVAMRLSHAAKRYPAKRHQQIRAETIADMGKLTSGNLQLDHRDRRIIIIATQVYAFDSIDAVGDHGRADISVRFLGPGHASRNGIVDVDTGQPRRGLAGVCASLDLGGQVGRPGFCIRQTVAAFQFLGHVGVPDVVQVRVFAVAKTHQLRRQKGVSLRHTYKVTLMVLPPTSRASSCNG